jgi:hypothetical protein
MHLQGTVSCMFGRGAFYTFTGTFHVSFRSRGAWYKFFLDGLGIETWSAVEKPRIDCRWIFFLEDPTYLGKITVGFREKNS